MMSNKSGQKKVLAVVSVSRIVATLAGSQRVKEEPSQLSSEGEKRDLLDLPPDSTCLKELSRNPSQ